MLNMNKKTLPDAIICQTLIAYNAGEYNPLITKEEINRNTFFHLRKQLIALGCPHDKVLKKAQQICMDILQIDDVNNYLRFILQDTYKRCKWHVDNGLELFPVQNPENYEYSHTSLFSSIYGYEINFLLSEGLLSGIADIGCGDGLFIKLARDKGIITEGFDINVPEVHHDIEINQIKDFTDIKKPYDCIVLNHVLEHIEISPYEYLTFLIEFFKRSHGKRINKILVSLPLHSDINSHLACGHHWICTNVKNLDTMLISRKEHFQISTFDPETEFENFAKKYNYNLTIYKQIGLFIFA